MIRNSASRDYGQDLLSNKQLGFLHLLKASRGRISGTPGAGMPRTAVDNSLRVDKEQFAYA